MANNLYQLLSRWHPQRDLSEWVLVTVVTVIGSNYRRPGAMMLISDLGETLGLISGGCLEKSLLNSAKKVLSSRTPLLVEIDSSAEGNLPALGCGGQVALWLQPVLSENNYQALDQLFHALNDRQSTYYAVSLVEDITNQMIRADNLNQWKLSTSVKPQNSFSKPAPSSTKPFDFLVIQTKPVRHLGIFGAGIDVKSLVAMAHLMGWQVSLVENRVGFGAAEDFPQARILRCDAESHQVKSLVKQLDAALVMSHNLALDAAALRQVQGVDYVGLLGPRHRREKVFSMAGVVDGPHIHGAQVHRPKVHGPMGLNLGGDLPEAIALSVVAEIHQVLELRDSNEVQLFDRSVLKMSAEH